MAKNVERSLQLTAEQLVEANIALSKLGSKSGLAADLKMSRTTISNFFAGRTVQRKEFHLICKKLKFNWQPVPQKNTVENIDEIVQNIREAMRPTILEKCGKMRVLDMEQPIGLNDIYTNVNILEKMTKHRNTDLIKMMQDISPEEFERFSFGAVKEERVPGLEAVERYNKLMILGKPGAGKTTFLKHLAIQCIGGNFQPHRIPVFVTLKEFAETEGKPNLENYLYRSIETSSIGTNDFIQLKNIFEAGRVLILLDGLDEVSVIHSSHVLRELRLLSEQYHCNQYVITCRIAAQEYIFELFTEVEISDFDKEQIIDFVCKWFHTKKEAFRISTFLQKLEDNPRIQQLATSPLLLILLCLVFEYYNDFPANRAELYKDGVDILLEKWDKKRSIKRDQFYKGLLPKFKKDMLSYIAWKTFETGNYFFKQKDLESHVNDFIYNAATADTCGQEIDSESVLKSIEAQHGLFVERAQKVYSFSHLTFHEYFTARQVKEESLWQALISHCTERRWREVVLLTAGMVEPNADKLMQQLKQEASRLVANDQGLQQFLMWANLKTQTVENTYNLPAIRAYYLWIGLDLAFEISRTSGRTLALALSREIATDLALDVALILTLDIVCDLIRVHSTTTTRSHISEVSRDFARARARNLAFSIARNLDPNLSREVNCARAYSLEVTFDSVLEQTCSLIQKISNCSKDFQQQWQSLLIKLPNADQLDQKTVQSWWGQDGQSWAEQLRTLMIKHRNIGHNWHLTSNQSQKIEQYLIVNQLLADCLNSNCISTHSVRKDIEDMLLLPIAEIKK
jgi:predicted NACHT family NTPase